MVLSEVDDLGVLWLLPCGCDEKDTPESWRSPTGMTPTGSGGTCIADGERRPFAVAPLAENDADEEEGDEEKKAPLKRALVLGAEATRRRNRLAEDPPPRLLGLGLAGNASTGSGGTLNEA